MDLIAKISGSFHYRYQWIFRNKLYENILIIRNRSRLIGKGYNEEERVDYDKTYALIARLEVIRLLLTYAYARNFKNFQMDVKNAFRNRYIMKRCMFNSLPSFKIIFILIMFVNFKRLYMILSKLQELGMKDVVIFSLKKVFEEER